MVAEMVVEVVMVAEMVVVAVITRLKRSDAFGCGAGCSPLPPGRRSSGSQRRHPRSHRPPSSQRSHRRWRCSQNILQSSEREEQFSLVWVRFAVVWGSLHASQKKQPAALPTTRASVRSPPPEAASGAHPLRPPILFHHGTPLIWLQQGDFAQGDGVGSRRKPVPARRPPPAPLISLRGLLLLLLLLRRLHDVYEAPADVYEAPADVYEAPADAPALRQPAAPTPGSAVGRNRMQGSHLRVQKMT